MGIEIKNISKSFVTKEKGMFHALEDINLNIDEGEIICLLGPSGCGKTTLLRIIAGLEESDIGEVYDNGELVKGPSKERGFIFQQYSLFPWMNVWDNVMFGLNLSDRDNEENLRRAERYLKQVGLIEFKDSYPHELSGGMKQRVAIIRTLLNHASTLLMDEPFSALDMQNRHNLQEQLIGGWKKFETTIIFVTHDVDEAVFLADKVVVMDKNPGKIKKIMDIDLPRVRKRDSEEFLKVQNDIEELLGVWED